MTTIINFYAGPGTGKSTSAAYVYYLLKSEHKNSELVREYVKNWSWEKRPINTYDQLYFLGKQSRYESMLYNKVDYIVTDSPVMLGGFYAKHFCPEAISKGIIAATQAFYDQAEQDGHKHHHVFLNRTKQYNPAGRYQTEEQAKDMDAGIRGYLNEMGIKVVECDTDAEALKKLLNSIIDEENSTHEI